MAVAMRSLGASLLGAVLAVVPLAVPSASADDGYAATIRDAQSAMADLVASGAVDSISVSLTDGTGLIWTGADGQVDAAGTPATATTMFGIGSVTKVFTAAAIMQLVEAGRIGLDQPVVKYLPTFRMRSPQHRQITVRMLLNHTAGFPGSDYNNGFTTKPFPGYAAQALATLADGTLKTTPGALAVYCNDCFTVAGEVVASVSGMPYTDYVERRILAPLGMTRSQFITDVMPAPGEAARAFDAGVVLPQEVTNIYASGGLLSTPSDMAKFAQAFLGNGTANDATVLAPASVAMMGSDQIRTTFTAVPNPLLTFGLGWDNVFDRSFAARGVRVLAKNGATGTYHADLKVAPDAGIAVFVNAAGVDPRVDGAVGALSQQLMMKALAERGAIVSAAPAPVDRPSAVKPTVDDVNAIVGVYATGTGGPYRVTRAAGDAVTLSALTDGLWSPLAHLTFHADGNWWPPEPAQAPFRAVTGWARTYLAQVTYLDGDRSSAQIPLGERVASSGPTDPAWRQRLGTWVAVNPRAESTIWRSGLPAFEITSIPGLPGYVAFGGTVLNAQGRAATVFAQVPQNNGRDQDDLTPLPGGLLRGGSWILMPADSIPALAPGASSLTINAQGHASLVRTPARGRVRILSATTWKLYGPDGALRSQGEGRVSIDVDSGATLVVFGEPGHRIRLDRS